MCRHRDNPFSLKAFAAEHRPSLCRLKRYSRLMTAIRAGRTRFRPHCRPARCPLRFAKLAPLGIVPELLVMKEKLFPCGKYKFISAIHALENLIDELHLTFPSRTAEIPQHRLQSPTHTGIVN